MVGIVQKLLFGAACYAESPRRKAVYPRPTEAMSSLPFLAAGFWSPGCTCAKSKNEGRRGGARQDEAGQVRGIVGRSKAERGRDREAERQRERKRQRERERDTHTHKEGPWIEHRHLKVVSKRSPNEGVAPDKEQKKKRPSPKASWTEEC